MKVGDFKQVDKQHGEGHVVCADAGYTGTQNRAEHGGIHIFWQIASLCSVWEKLGIFSALYRGNRKIEMAKARTKAKVGDPFRAIWRQFGYVNTRFQHGAVCVNKSVNGPATL